MKTFIRVYFFLLSIVLLLSCKDNESSIVSPESKINNYLFSSGNGVEKNNNNQIYEIYSEDNKPIESDIPQAPDSIINKSKKYIYSLLGESYYNAHLEYRSSNVLTEEWYTYNNGGRYTVTHYYKIAIKDFATNLIVTTYHDSLGNVIENEGVVSRLEDTTLGIPFNIDDSMAVGIAMNNKYESGYFPWHVTFQYDVRNQRYVWNIKNQTESNGGNAMIIDAQNGNIIEVLSWVIIFD